MNIEYWNLRGYGNRVRELAYFLDLDFTETRLTGETAPDYFARKQAPGHQLMNLPSITDGDIYVSETSACVVYLMEKAGRLDMMNNNWQREQVNSIIKDMNTGSTMPCYSSADMPALLAALNPKVEGWSKFQMSGLADILGSKPFLFGDAPVMVDFFLCDFLERWLTMDNELETKTKIVKGTVFEAYLARFLALPKIAAFRASDKFILRPFNGWQAVWH